MALKRYSCRTHTGGIFTKEAARGRPPVRCTEDYPCDKAGYTADTAEIKPIRVTPARAAKSPEVPATAPKSDNPSLPLALAAKAQLEAVGWSVKGRAWIMDMSGWQMAEVTASRGAETLVITWVDGELNEQDYSMEYLKPSDNGIPGRKLNFDPEELTDRELVDRISGMKVTWWNTLASSTETAVIGPQVSIEHIFNAGDADNYKRLVKFVDRNAGGFRAFHTSALMKVG